ncbi:MAG: ABC transporter ATP-binding protein [Clostridia bacterium]|nr:ABC transporter ATP-binding protein [Clostridia bacterium]
MAPPPGGPGGFGGPGGRRGPRRELTEEEKKNAPKLTWPLVKRVVSWLKPYTLRLFLVLLLILVAELLSVVPSLLTGRMIDEGLYGGDVPLLIKLAGFSLLVLIVSNVISAGQVYLTTWIGQHVTFDMRNKMYAHLQKMGHRFFTSNMQGDIITRMTEDIGGVQTVIANTFLNLFSNCAAVIVVLVTLFQKNWILAIISILLVPFLILPTRFVGKKRWEIADATQRQRDKSNQILNETLSVSGQLLVKLFTNEKREYEAYEAINRETMRLHIKERMMGLWFWRTLHVLRGIVPLLIYVAAGIVMFNLGHGDLTVGDVTVIVSLVNRLHHPVDQLLNIQVDVIRSMALFTRIFEYFDLKPDVVDPENGYAPQEVQGDIAFEKVEFSYTEEKDLLKDITFRADAGKTIAIVGASGSGKSTLVNLIPRLYDVQGGGVTLDGVDIREWDLTALRRQVAAVTQETYLFNDTVRANLLYAKHDATDDELEQACRDANIHDFIMTLPQGYDTEVGNRGFKLSGGEKQRLSIARAILKDPKVLILDEATSSLDSISENLIQEAIGPLLKGRTSIVIAHRLTTVLAADEILVMKNGRIVERGRHAELVEQEGVYRELYETQFRYALDDYEKRKSAE